ncbi:MAG TPA: MG2 domain-containing protein, partial [Kofleriaceae bacterium]|nr:MG2 domain-containing protein [Kofleriaceae bacterium]
GSQPARPVVPHAPAAAAPSKSPAKGRAEVTLSSVAAGDLGLEMLTATADATAGVTTSELSAAETNALYARMEPLPVLDNSAAPALRPPAPMPPGPGTIQPIAFAAPAGASVADKPIQRAPLAPPRLDPPQILPIGEVPAESAIRVRFAEPMVAVDRVGATNAAVATIEPPVHGTWRWLDTRVAEFTSQAPRLAQATPYKVTVASAKALSGAVLGEPVTGTFATPPISIEGLYPNRNVRPDAPIAVQLDQDFDEAAIAKRLLVRAGKRTLAVTRTTLVTAQPLWAKNPSFAFDLKALGSRWILISPEGGAWPAGATIDVTLPKGAPSREGPRLSEHDSKRSFTVAAPFTVRGLDCDYWQAAPKLARTCPALANTRVTFSNEVDEKLFRAEMVQLAGQPLQDHAAQRNEVTVSLPDIVHRTFAIDLANELRDIYGQPLTGPHHLSVTTSRYVYAPYLWAQTGLYVLDPRFHIPQWTVDAQAVTSMRIELYRVAPADYFAYSEFERGKRKAPPGTRVWAKDFTVGERFAGEARVDLTPALVQGSGHVVAIATAIPALPVHEYDGFQPRLTAWIQITKLGLTSRVDQEHVHAWVDDISPSAFLSPRPDATASLVIAHQPVTAMHADAHGEATLELPPALPGKKPPLVTDWEYPQANALVVAAAGSDSVFAAIDREARTERVRNALWYVTDDRFTYKPGEPVYVKGWVRWTHDGINPGLELPGADGVAYEVYDSKHERIAAGKVAFTDQGGFDFQFDVPESASLGAATIELHTKTQDYAHVIAVQEFRTPAYAVNLDDDVWS